ncbi:MAG: hypothetical protein E7654_05355 [Ruminococcaceae bacterium]|nr:hypothetical protein [Oscillospiraceae bacterium]
MEKFKEKLSSRKLWAAILAGAAALVAACFGEELTPEIVSALKCAVTAAIAYIFGEGAVDVARLIASSLGGTGLPSVNGEEKGTNPKAE